jgi:hypothetical protein
VDTSEWSKHEQDDTCKTASLHPSLYVQDQETLCFHFDRSIHVPVTEVTTDLAMRTSCQRPGISESRARTNRS